MYCFSVSSPLALDRRLWLGSRSDRFTSGEKGRGSHWTGGRVGLRDEKANPVPQSSWCRTMPIKLGDHHDRSTYMRTLVKVSRKYTGEFIHFKENLSGETLFSAVTHYKTCEEVLESQTLDKSIETCVYCPISHVTFTSACLLNPPHDYSSPCVHGYNLMGPLLFTIYLKHWATTCTVRDVSEICD